MNLPVGPTRSLVQIHRLGNSAPNIRAVTSYATWGSWGVEPGGKVGLGSLWVVINDERWGLGPCALPKAIVRIKHWRTHEIFEKVYHFVDSCNNL